MRDAVYLVSKQGVPIAVDAEGRLVLSGAGAGFGTGVQEIHVGAMMDLQTDEGFTARNPLLRVKDSGTVEVLLTAPAHSELTLKGHRYGRAVTVYVHYEQTEAALVWGIADLGDDFFLGAPEVHTETIVPIFNAAGTAVAGQLHVTIDPDDGVKFVLIGTVNTVGAYADFSFSFVTPSPWPDSVPYTAPEGTTTLDYTDPAPEAMGIVHTGPSDPNVGASGSFDATLDQTPDGPVTLHMSLNGGEPTAIPMAHVSGDDWTYDYPSGLYYGSPSIDVDDEVSSFVTAAFEGRSYTSNVVTFTGE